jgi:hypothetical protein
MRKSIVVRRNPSANDIIKAVHADLVRKFGNEITDKQMIKAIQKCSETMVNENHTLLTKNQADMAIRELKKTSDWFKLVA